ncbi:ATPase [Candidatus Aerophobetes bacterium]|uniref:ATPase n=1 Tax=Aerophobetes bacterium TaxID=2030807 RepID=A0A523S216_UNCAE|nr:MAG: ATPase [Candidatus Aerophobetes bacterium]
MRYVLGVDGGGTITKSLVADEKGNLLGQGIGGPSNYQVLGVEKAIDAVDTSIKEAIRMAGVKKAKFKVICLGLAGVGRSVDYEVVGKALKRLNLAQKIVLQHDAFIALAGATICQPGVVIIAGTGATAFGINKEEEVVRANGWGPLLGDEGSSHDIGQKMLRAVVRAHDGRGKATLLTFKLIQYFKLKSLLDIVQKVYRNKLSTTEIAALAPLVVEAAKEGDEVAARILKQAGEELGTSVVAVIKNLKMERQEFEIAMIGGVFKAEELILPYFEERIRREAPKARFIKPRFEPAIGAIFLGLQEIGVEIDEKVLKRVEDSYMRLRKIKGGEDDP